MERHLRPTEVPLLCRLWRSVPPTCVWRVLGGTQRRLASRHQMIRVLRPPMGLFRSRARTPRPIRTPRSMTLAKLHSVVTCLYEEIND